VACALLQYKQEHIPQSLAKCCYL